MDDDLWRLRLRRDAFLLPDSGTAPPACPSFVGKVVSTGTNLGVGKFFKVNPVDATGAETEGGAGTLTANTSVSVLVYALGPGAPATGDFLICRFVNYRWVAEKKVAAPSNVFPTVGCCPTTGVPRVLNLTATSATPQPGGATAVFVDATLTYQPFGTTTAPDGLHGPCTASGIYSCSDAWWSTLQQAGTRFASYCPSVNGDVTLGYYYVFICGVSDSHHFQLVVIKACRDHTTGNPVYALGSGTSWDLNTSGNSCSPFLLAVPSARASDADVGQADIVISG